MSDIITRLKDIYDKYNSLSQKLSDPEVIGDAAEWAKLAKEQSELTEPFYMMLLGSDIREGQSQAESRSDTNILVRVGEDFHEFSEPVTHCPWCGREL